MKRLNPDGSLSSIFFKATKVDQLWKFPAVTVVVWHYSSVRNKWCASSPDEGSWLEIRARCFIPSFALWTSCMSALERWLMKRQHKVRTSVRKLHWDWRNTKSYQWRTNVRSWDDEVNYWFRTTNEQKNKVRYQGTLKNLMDGYGKASDRWISHWVLMCEGT